MILTFADAETEKIWNGRRSRALSGVPQDVARRKLRQIQAAETPLELANPPGNRFEKLHGTGEPRYSIRINDQWRIVLHWSDGGANGVQIMDYHKG